MRYRLRHNGFTALLGFVFSAFCLLAPVGNLHAGEEIESADKQPAPIYNPATKSYFQRRTDMPDLAGGGWLKAERKAKSLVFHGTRGRLAMVRDVETHSFLRANFKFDSTTWIGLRFFCSVRKLVWVDGSEHKRSEFKAWGRQWFRNNNVRCRNQTKLGFMPVYYLPDEQGFKWQAAGPAKGGFNAYLVEYPTGKP